MRAIDRKELVALNPTSHDTGRPPRRFPLCPLDQFVEPLLGSLHRQAELTGIDAQHIKGREDAREMTNHQLVQLILCYQRNTQLSHQAQSMAQADRSRLGRSGCTPPRRRGFVDHVQYPVVKSLGVAQSPIDPGLHQACIVGSRWAVDPVDDLDGKTEIPALHHFMQVFTEVRQPGMRYARALRSVPPSAPDFDKRKQCHSRGGEGVEVEHPGRLRLLHRPMMLRAFESRQGVAA